MALAAPAGIQRMPDDCLEQPTADILSQEEEKKKQKEEISQFREHS